MARNTSRAAEVGREERRDKVISLVHRGASYRETARIVGVGVGTVARDVEARLREGARARRGHAELFREKQRQQLGALLVRWWKGATSDPPDAAAMDRVLRILEREAKLLGLDAPQQLRHAGPDGGAIPVKPDLSALTDDELRKIRALLAR